MRPSSQSRRQFLSTVSVAMSSLIAAPVLLGAPGLIGLTQKGRRAIVGGFVDDGSGRGHALRDGRGFSRARERRRASVAIVGGGMGGLSAAWQLDRSGVDDWVLLELADSTGGNARSGSNAISRFPWGAHYVPVPAADAVHVRALFRELDVLHADGTWDERMLCHSPQERIWQHGRWHEGLEPLDASTASDRAQFARFEAMIDEWRATGAFSVPSASGQARGRAGATANALRALDAQTADTWLQSHGFTSPALRWWVEYGTRDDYGASLTQASAWAAVHYFASRAADEEGPLTWPEGNDWIARRLAARLESRRRGRIVTQAPVWQIERTGQRWLVKSPAVDIECDAIIWAAPLFILPRALAGVRLPVELEYAPWVVANLVLDRSPVERGAPLAWDSVIYGSPSLGYVNATHQSLATPGTAQVWTWYHAVVDRPAKEARAWLQQQAWASWRDRIVADLAHAHRDIADCVVRIDVLRAGHAMARPTPGLLGRVQTLARWQPAPQLYLAHADLSGISLFEEAQWHGVQAATRAARIVRGG